MKIRTDNFHILSEGFETPAPPAWAGPGPHYVLATEGDPGLPIYECNKYGQPVKIVSQFGYTNDPEPLVHETCLHKASTLDQVRERAKLHKRYGQMAIYRLELVEVLP